MAKHTRALPGRFSGLSVKIIATIAVVILAVEIAVYLPTAASFRQSWLEDRLRVGTVAARVLDAVPDAMNLPRTLTEGLLTSAGALALVYRRDEQSQLIEREGFEPPEQVVTVDLRQTDWATLVLGTLDTLAAPPGRILRIVGEEAGQPDRIVEVLMPEAPLGAELWLYSRNIFFLSLILAVITSAVLYVLVSRILIFPIRRLTNNMVAFSEAPENPGLIVSPTTRRDELGVMERELSAMETDIYSMLRQRRHLADLGLAVAKINHDLRNTLTSAQLLSDQVANLDDPKVQRLAPRLVHSIDRAIGFAQSVLDYGRQSVTPPKPVPVDLHLLLDEAAFDAGLVGHPSIGWRNDVPDAVSILADPDLFARIFSNLLKNAREALEGANGKIEAPLVELRFDDGAEWLTLSVCDNGPGLPPRARENLFVAFEGSARAGGTGLGLAIARELTEAHGGRVSFIDQPLGTRFDVVLPHTIRLG
ncbi:MAG: sensor histidine kinase [Devosia sp.]